MNDLVNRRDLNELNMSKLWHNLYL